LGWNVESGTPSESDPAEGIDPAEIAEQLEIFGAYDIIGLTEVSQDNVSLFATAAGAEPILSDTGGGDRMVILYDIETLELLEVVNLHEFGGINFNPLDSQGRFRVRSPLIAHFRIKSTGVEFLYALNHLARGDNDLREDQARGLCAWAAAQTLPVVAMGDYNFDFEIDDGRGNLSFDLFLDCDEWDWIEPVELVDTNWSDANPLADVRLDSFPNSILDFAFLSGPAIEWSASSRIIVRDNDFPDTGQTSDHRPVELIVGTGIEEDVVETPPGATEPVGDPSIATILQLITEIRALLDTLEVLVRGLAP
jgi:endonuclease/exonuclease/phosphatase family metal-dependent hydrolase